MKNETRDDAVVVVGCARAIIFSLAVWVAGICMWMSIYNFIRDVVLR
jgi:hypothetical protein